MGFRSVLITEDRRGVEVPPEFLVKHPTLQAVRNEEDGKTYFPLSSMTESKFYANFEEHQLFLDIQKLLRNIEHFDLGINIVLLHECGGITKVIIYKDRIVGMEPTGWKMVEAVEHDYCYGCSDPPK